MKIAYLMQAGVPDLREHPLSGPANHVKHVFCELQALGHELKLIAQLDGQFWASEDLETFRPIEVKRPNEWLWRLCEKIVRRIQATFGLPYAAWFESRRFAQACQQELSGFDVLYERMGWMGYGGGIAAKAMDIPWMLEVNGDHLDELASLGMAPTGGQKWLSMQAMGRAVRQVAHVVAVGEGWKQRFIERWAFDAERMSIVENGSEMVDRLDVTSLRTHHHSPQPSADTSVETDYRKDSINIVYIGGFEPWHGVTVLVEAVASAVAQNPHIRLQLIGDGSELSKIRALIDANKLASVVTITGYLSAEEMVPYLQEAEIGACPYCGRANFSGLKILDYKAAGLATIASGQDGEPAILEHGKTGWIVPPGDVEALASAIVQLSSEHQLRRNIGQSARADAESAHRWHHTAKALEEIFAKVAVPK